MNPNALGVMVVGLLVIAALPSSMPSEPWTALIFVLGVFLLERFGMRLDPQYRFSPAAPAYLAMAMHGGVGTALAAVAVAAESLSRPETGFLANLSHKLAVSLAILAIAGTILASPATPQASWIVGPSTYLGCRLWLDGKRRTPTRREENLVWHQLYLRIRPLELGLAAAAPVLVGAARVSPLLVAALLPLLATARLAAENVWLKARDSSLGDALKELQGVQMRHQKTARERDDALRQKQLLEGFSAHLSRQPTLESVAATLVATVFEMMPVETAVVFLGQPPEPFSYRASDSQRQRLQGATLTGLREPLVDRAALQGNPKLQKTRPEGTERLLNDDVVAAAVPLGTLGILYVGREKANPFRQPELDTVRWLASMAEIALDISYRASLQQREQREQQQTVQNLERKVAWLGHLVSGAEAFASSLESTVLEERLIGLLQQIVPHQRGYLALGTGQEVQWGGEIHPHPDFLETVREAGERCRSKTWRCRVSPHPVQGCKA